MQEPEKMLQLCSEGRRILTPGISASSKSSGWKQGVGRLQSMMTPVLVLRMRTVVTGSAMHNWALFKRNKGIAADMLPQFTLQSIDDFSEESCASVLLKSE